MAMEEGKTGNFDAIVDIWLKQM